MARTRKSLVRYGPVVLATTAAAHSAFAPLRSGAAAATPHATPAAQTAPAVSSPDAGPLSIDSTSTTASAIRPAFAATRHPSLQTHNENPAPRTPSSTLLPPQTGDIISLLKSSNTGTLVPSSTLEPILLPPVIKSDPIHLDPGQALSGAVHINGIVNGQANLPLIGPTPVPEPLTGIPLLTLATLLHRPKKISPQK